MTESDADRLRLDFLKELDAEMHDIPHGVAAEIRAGIDEELTGLDAGATAARIAQLGAPAVIAREAQAEMPGAVPVIVAAPHDAIPKRKTPFVDTKGYAITSALVLAFGGFVVPVVGWFVGAVLVSSSSLWRRWEKAVAILLPFAVGVLLALVAWIAQLVTSGGADAGQEHNPLLPTAFDLWHSGILLVFLIVPITGGWLLWRLRRR